MVVLSACNADTSLTTPAHGAPVDSLPAPTDTSRATFSPLVGQIAFTSTRDGSPYIYVASADGSSLRRLTKGRDPSWSWDGRQILFYGSDYVADSSVHVINADGSGERVLRPGGALPEWSPDGKRLAFTTDLGLYIANRDGSNATLLVSSDWQRPGDLIGEAQWSPDGKRIAFTSGDWDTVGFGVYVANVDGSGVFGTAMPGSVPRWSPDGSMIAFGTTAFAYFGGNGPHLPAIMFVVAVAKPDGSDMRLVDTGGLAIASCDWSPDGRSLLLSTGHRVFVTDTAFRATRQLVHEAVAPAVRPYDDYGAVWSRVVVP
jgi:Tol biopolymer transport system component